jgi:hypothetical protein
MQKLPSNIYEDVKDTAGRMYGYTVCKKAEALKPTFEGESEFYELDDGQAVIFYTEAQLEVVCERDITAKKAGPGSIVQIVDMGGNMWRFYSVVIPGKRSYSLSST